MSETTFTLANVVGVGKPAPTAEAKAREVESALGGKAE